VTYQQLVSGSMVFVILFLLTEAYHRYVTARFVAADDTML
jgi:hypothetical protein